MPGTSDRRQVLELAMWMGNILLQVPVWSAVYPQLAMLKFYKKLITYLNTYKHLNFNMFLKGTKRYVVTWSVVSNLVPSRGLKYAELTGLSWSRDWSQRFLRSSPAFGDFTSELPPLLNILWRRDNLSQFFKDIIFYKYFLKYIYCLTQFLNNDTFTDAVKHFKICNMCEFVAIPKCEIYNFHVHEVL